MNGRWRAIRWVIASTKTDQTSGDQTTGDDDEDGKREDVDVIRGHYRDMGEQGQVEAPLR